MRGKEQQRRQKTEQVEKSADIADENALVRLGIFFARLVDESLFLPLFHLYFGKPFVEIGVEPRDFRRVDSGGLFALFLFLFFGEKGLEMLFALFLFGRIFDFFLFFLFHDSSLKRELISIRTIVCGVPIEPKIQRSASRPPPFCSVFCAALK